MYSVFVADDEPAAVRAICMIIERRTEDFVVCGTAKNGREALDGVLQCAPDLVISDIRMPFVSGLEVMETLRRKLPDTYFLVVSGYQNFDYAQRALRSNAVDYLLKPVSPSSMLEALNKVRKKLEKERYYARNQLLKKMCFGEEADGREVRKLFPFEALYLGIVRNNGLPRAFSYDAREEIFSEMTEQYIIFGRDEMESMYIIPESMLPQEAFLPYMKKVMERQDVGKGYQTLLYFDRAFPVTELPRRIERLYRELSGCLSVGVTRICRIRDDGRNLCEQEPDTREIDGVLQEAAELLRLNRRDLLRQNLRELYLRWGREQKPLYWVESVSQRILQELRRYQGERRISIFEGNKMIEEIFGTAATMEELTEALFDIFFPGEDEIQCRIDSPEFFEKLLHYMEERIRTELSVQELCRSFGVSQTYVNKLFHKYAGCSFSRKLTALRMEKAKQYVRQGKEFFVKDIAGMVGYRDQFYFSRVFRAYVGVSPSDYAEEFRGGG